uniref:Uncharacterized protein n=1 Tax=Anguilla anguilla TaxID=7936 RepID=A0A0E9PSV8_ANGAN
MSETATYQATVCHFMTRLFLKCNKMTVRTCTGRTCFVAKRY